MLPGGMFGNLVNKNARAALKEYGDMNGVGIEYEMLAPAGPSHSPQYSARVRVGESSFDAATAATKKDAKEFAADLALRALSQEPGTFAMYSPIPAVLPGLSPDGAPHPQHRTPGFRPKYNQRYRQRPKNNQLSAPPDKDPVMLINEYGQKMSLQVKFEDSPCSFPGLYESKVTVGTQEFGPKRSAQKKMARKLAAIVGLKELINWEPKEGLYYLNEEPAVLTSLPGLAPEGSDSEQKGVVLDKDPVMLLNEYCQRSQLKITYEDKQHNEPGNKRSYSCNATVGDRTFESGRGSTKNKAKKEAALLALKTLFNMQIQMPQSSKGAKKSVEERHPVSVLNEFGQKHNQKVEFVDLGYTGPDHNRTYSYLATVGDRKFDCGYGRSKQEAKKECAKIALGVLLGIPVEPGPVQPSESVPGENGVVPKQQGVKSRVSALYEFCQAYHLPQPEPIEVKHEFRVNPGSHYMAFKIGEQSYPPGEGRTKKAAKEIAAGHALTELEKANTGSMYSPVGSCEGDQLAALSWQCLTLISNHAAESWRLAGYKVLAAFIMQDSSNPKGTVVSIGTGNKCIGGDQLRLEGTVVFDSHAEVIARRGLVRFLLSQLNLLFEKPSESKSIFLPKIKGQQIKLREDVKFSLYISTAPCGDASVFVSDTASGSEGADQLMFGSKQHGLLRTKVEKGEGTIPLDPDDSIQTIDGIRRGQRLRTASCSDKLAKWNVLGLQGALLSNLIEPIYLNSLVVGNLFEASHLTRAVSARIEREAVKPLSSRLPSPYRVNLPKIQCGRLAPVDSPRDVETKSKTKNLTLNWCLGDEKRAEVLDACLGRDPNNRVPSRLSKMAIYANFLEVAKKNSEYKKVVEAKSYRKAKDQASDYLNAKNTFFQHMKEAQYGDWGQMKKPVELSQFA
ncbi:double-stranded RNA-specific adenosine deaminase [Nematostella vectensis]|uniref:double-stranded RNA-specific adenosine deaminase n=1 Tax=Nematostella vectensis TaxID=45351 RepID=UPI0020770B93|nr:double-stranded RNA-specific adenosine deaminase [Nematostella vectensis]